LCGRATAPATPPSTRRASRCRKHLAGRVPGAGDEVMGSSERFRHFLTSSLHHCLQRSIMGACIEDEPSPGGPMDTLTTRLAVKCLHPLFVGEVTGIDLTVPIPREDFRAIWDAFNEHQILVFRDQDFDDASQIAFSRNFGEL